MRSIEFSASVQNLWTLAHILTQGARYQVLVTHMMTGFRMRSTVLCFEPQQVTQTNTQTLDQKPSVNSRHTKQTSQLQDHESYLK